MKVKKAKKAKKAKLRKMRAEIEQNEEELEQQKQKQRRDEAALAEEVSFLARQFDPTTGYCGPARDSDPIMIYRLARLCDPTVEPVPHQSSTKDAERATVFYEIAAEEDHMAAQHRLGECFDKGEGVEVDKAQAAFWYRRAANQGDVEAQFRVGVMYAEGLVVKNNRKAKQRATHFMKLAANQGCEKSVAMLKELRKCDGCGTLDVHHMMCPLCKMVRYCNRECQVAHWKRPTDSHRSLCAKTHRAPTAVAVRTAATHTSPGAY
jgi:hypothetical protein